MTSKTFFQPINNRFFLISWYLKKRYGITLVCMTCGRKLLVNNYKKRNNKSCIKNLFVNSTNLSKQMSVRSSEGLAGLSIESFLFNDRSAGSAWFQLNWKSAFLPISPLSLLNTHTRLTGNRNHFFSFESNESSSTCLRRTFRPTRFQSDSRPSSIPTFPCRHQFYKDHTA